MCFSEMPEKEIPNYFYGQNSEKNRKEEKDIVEW